MLTPPLDHSSPALVEDGVGEGLGGWDGGPEVWRTSGLKPGSGGSAEATAHPIHHTCRSG